VNTPQGTIRRIVHVSRRPTGESLRSARAIKKLDGVRLFGICEQSPHADEAGVFVDLVRVNDTHDAGQLITAARMLSQKHGSLHQIVTAHETLLEPVARVTEALGLPGMRGETVRRALDKSRLKRTLEHAGIKTARDRLITSSTDALGFVDEVNFPIVLKVLRGGGGLVTWCVRSVEQLEVALALMRPSVENAVLAQDYLRGQELCLDTITIANEPRFHSICCYRPSILEALENPPVQWSCVMPRDISGEPFQEFIEHGLKAVRALSVGNAVTHMEGFLLEEGGVSFTDATLRPAGARIGPMLEFAYELDSHFAWARAAVDGCFDGPWERQYAVGTFFLRGIGSGLVEHVCGIEEVEQRLGELLVDVRWPRVGATRSATYTGDGYVTVRHPETRVVEDALQLIAQTVRITYSYQNAPAPLEERWSRQIQYFHKQLYRPDWEDDCLRVPGDS
jgi:ATP-grasp N-terminal domain/RimK-like ATP-grasp domain